MSRDLDRRTAPAALDESTVQRYSELRKIAIFVPNPEVVREFAMVHNGRGLAGLVLWLRGRALSRSKAASLLRQVMEAALTAAFKAAPDQRPPGTGRCLDAALVIAEFVKRTPRLDRERRERLALVLGLQMKSKLEDGYRILINVRPDIDPATDDVSGGMLVSIEEGALHLKPLQTRKAAPTAAGNRSKRPKGPVDRTAQAGTRPQS